MIRATPFFRTLCLLLVAAYAAGCVHGKDPVILNEPPREPFEVIGPVEVKTEWHGLHWLWHWWHYMPWHSSIYKIHDQKLIRKARKLGADAIIKVEYFPHRRGAKGEAIRYVLSKPSE